VFHGLYSLVVDERDAAIILFAAGANFFDKDELACSVKSVGLFPLRFNR